MDKVVYKVKAWRWIPSKDDYDIEFIELPVHDKEKALEMFKKNFKSSKVYPQVDLYEDDGEEVSKLASHEFLETGSSYLVGSLL